MARKRMALIATPNLCFDRAVRLRSLEVGAVHRTQSVTVTAGGKGVNIARILRTLSPGREATATLFGTFAAPDADRIRELLTGEGIEHEVVAAAGEFGRNAMLIFTDTPGQVTVINEAGVPLSEAQWDAYRAAVIGRLDSAPALACSGSLPAGVQADAYAPLVAAANDAGLTTVVDSAPAALAASLAASPTLVTPNLEEAEAALQGGDGLVLASQVGDVEGRARSAAAALVGAGAKNAAVTAGANGIAFASPSGTHWLDVPQVELVSPVGAGDAFVAGLLSLGPRPEWGQGEWIAAIRYAAAVASASCEQAEAGRVDPGRIGQLAGGRRP